MPRYRMIKPPPDVLVYRDAQVALDEYQDLGNRWHWRAQKVGGRYSATLILSARSQEELQAMRKSGFETVAGSAADKIVRSLVAKGYAEQLD